MLNVKRERDFPEEINDKPDNQNNSIENSLLNSINEISQKEISIKEEIDKDENIQNMNISMEKEISLKEEEEEEKLADLVFQLNSKNSGVDCFICKKDLTKNIKFLCQKCNNQVFCIRSWRIRR